LINGSENYPVGEAAKNAQALMCKLQGDRYIKVMEDKYGKEENLSL